MAKRVFVNCKDYNGHKNVKFVMRPNDFRLTDEVFSDDYETLGDVNVLNNGFAFSGKLYTVHSDWSVSSK